MASLNVLLCALALLCITPAIVGLSGLATCPRVELLHEPCNCEDGGVQFIIQGAICLGEMQQVMCLADICSLQHILWASFVLLAGLNLV
jgi:hypothetical protein